MMDHTELLYPNEQQMKLQTAILFKCDCLLHSRGSNLQSECGEEPPRAVTFSD